MNLCCSFQNLGDVLGKTLKLKDIPFFTKTGDGGCKFLVVNAEKKIIPLLSLGKYGDPPNKNIYDSVALGTWLEYSLK